jgi:malate dehydrogenase (quinone)
MSTVTSSKSSKSSTEPKHSSAQSPDVVLVGAGIMSATLGVMLKELQPDLTIEIFEILDSVAAESSNGWNNAGTGHAALCELNYTPQKPDGSIDVSKALEVNAQFNESRQFWAWLVERGIIKDPDTFIQPVPHISFVSGEKDVAFLRKRWEALKEHPGFSDMIYSEDPAVLHEWMPLVMEGRNPKVKVAATRMLGGTDVDFGSLTKALIAHLQSKPGVTVNLGHAVTDLKRGRDQRWRVTVKDRALKRRRKVSAKFVFLGAGGGALPLLQKSDIPEGKGFGGFPVSGQWLRCDNPELALRHDAKVYGKASVGAPPMSVPHLDTRVIDGQRSLLFGPYAGFTTKYLKNGSPLDFPFSFRPDNLIPMIAAGMGNIPLTEYLIGQVVQSPQERLKALKAYLPKVDAADWRLEEAGQRVQVIKKHPKKGGILQFGTEVVAAKDGSIAALLGASPGASTAVSIMLNLIKRCFPEEFESSGWQEKVKAMVPARGESMSQNPLMLKQMHAWTSAVLGL